MTARVWDITELAAGRNTTKMPARLPTHLGGVALAEPAEPVTPQVQFRGLDRQTRTILRELARLTYIIAADVPMVGGAGDSVVTLAEVGRGRLTLSLTLAEDAGAVTVQAVRFGDKVMAPTTAARWLKDRVAP